MRRKSRDLLKFVKGGVSALAFSIGLQAGAAHAATPFPLGAWITTPNGSDAGAEAIFDKNFRHFQAKVGAAPRLIDVYVDMTQAVVSWPSNASWVAWSNAQSIYGRHMTPVIGFPMASIASGSASADSQFQWFASGAYDSEIKGVVQAWVAQGFKTLIFRPGWEMNIEGNTYAGATQQNWTDWVAAFRHISTVLHKAGAAAGASIQVVWNPGATNYASVSATGSLYPGDSYVDIVGVDFYANMFPFTDGNGEYHDWNTGKEDSSLTQFMQDPVNRKHYWTYPAATEWSNDGSDGHSETFAALLQFAESRGKPFAVPETGAGNSQGGHDRPDEASFPQWLHDQLATAKRKGTTISFVNIWDANYYGNYEFSYGADNKPNEAAAWAKYFGG